MEPERTHRGATGPPSAEPTTDAFAEAVGQPSRRMTDESLSRPRPPDNRSLPRLQTLEARLERLEKAHEGLQDALYRHEVLQDKRWRVTQNRAHVP